ncbi:efflux RND transporter periplasmic adaptor subunit [Paenimyroides aestuarii]|uniref:Efflux RND transporter periplasmic adaptor subunit n=1 Tax=Paenimyroides aestuarii TaxID=2968490 RepID=A0ABY5NSQ3_9FLAO|nr:efflux RND transporter periplasmic adaptor subunit [Paenimyroides aestuarii]UUV21610.1 efflux RND transporter periplasmic adaptor subunit [Paenimyroides aestuarii]
MIKKAFVFLSFSLAFLTVGCQSHKEEAHEKTTFSVTSPLVKDTIIYKDYVAQIRSVNHIEIRAQEKGYLQKIFVDEGQFVKKGQLLFKIMPNLYEADANRAKAEANYAQIEYKNTKQLYDNNVVSTNELALAKAKYDKAQAELASMKTHLQFTEIRAPFDGIIDRFHARLGSLITEGDLLTELADNSKMWVYFNVPEAEYLDQMAHKSKDSLLQVKLKMANGELFDHDGFVETIEADFDNETGNIAYRATFPNPKALLRFGQTGNVVISTPIKNALLIPQKATFEVLDKKYVFIVTKGNIVKAREIKIAAEIPHIYIVGSGLQASDKILIDGLRLVKENEKISYKFIQPAKVLSSLELYAE